MSREVHPIKANFTGGEVTPKVLEHVTADGYNTLSEEITNFYVDPLGSLTKRSGTKYIGEITDQSALSGKLINKKLVPFVFSETQTYMQRLWVME